MIIRKTQLALIIGLIVSSAGYASTDPSASSSHLEADKKADKADAIIVVKDQAEDGLSSKTTLDSQAIRDMPAGNGNLTDYLKSNPNVRFEADAENGFQGGEIKPSSISINGAEASQNAYMVDGVNINNDIDPLGSLLLEGTPSVLPGKSSEQAYFFDAGMLGGITVYDSNVSASLGGFTGGAVVADTLKYSGIDQVDISYRTTQSSWAAMKIDDSIKDKYEQAAPDGSTAQFQPDYKKDFYNLVAQKGLTENLGLVFGLSRRDSSISQSRVIDPKKGTIEKQNQGRRSDNMMTNLSWMPDNDKRLDIGLRYSGYEEKLFSYNTIKNDFKDKHEALGITTSWQQPFAGGTITAKASYDSFSDKRESNNNSNVTIIDGDNYYYMGGYGDSKLNQQNTRLMLDYQADPFFFAGLNHQFSVGSSFQHTEYQFERYSDVHSKIIMSGMVISESTALAGNVSTSHNNYALYLEDKIRLGDWSFRPGLRVEKDDYLGNTNFAPRFAMDWQALDSTRLTFGANRYYGRSFASMKLAEEISKLNQDKSQRYSKSENLRTPFSDELSFKINHTVGNFALTAGYVWRDNKDRLEPKKITIDKKLTNQYINSDKFHVDVYTLQVSNIRPWELGETLWTTTLGLDWLNTDRSDLGSRINPNEAVILDGKEMTRSQMEKAVNSSQEDWTARFGVDMRIPRYQLTWSNKVYVKAPVQGYSSVKSDGDMDVYKSYDYGTLTQWDTSLRWEPSTWKDQRAYIQLDLLNVLNQVRQTSSKGISSSESYGLYTPGRQLWVEVGYRF